MLTGFSMKIAVCCIVAVVISATSAVAGNTNVKINNTDAFLGRPHPFDNPAAAAEAAGAVPGIPYVDPVAGQILTQPPVGYQFYQPHPFDSPDAREAARRAIPGAPVIDPRAAIDSTRPDVTPMLDQPFPYGMWAPPFGGAPPLPGERAR